MVGSVEPRDVASEELRAHHIRGDEEDVPHAHLRDRLERLPDDPRGQALDDREPRDVRHRGVLPDVRQRPLVDVIKLRVVRGERGGVAVGGVEKRREMLALLLRNLRGRGERPQAVVHLREHRLEPFERAPTGVLVRVLRERVVDVVDDLLEVRKLGDARLEARFRFLLAQAAVADAVDGALRRAPEEVDRLADATRALDRRAVAQREDAPAAALDAEVFIRRQRSAVL
eukprot:31346-Pelagococcus_subviridis.AAC.9